MDTKKEVTELIEMLKQCDECGACLEVCSTYKKITYITESILNTLTET